MNYELNETTGLPIGAELVQYGPATELLGGSMRSAYDYATQGQWVISQDGRIEEWTLPVNSGIRLLRLEPLPKKRKVLVLELPIQVGGNVRLDCGGFTGSMYFDAEKFARNNGGTIKEVDDVE